MWDQLALSCPIQRVPRRSAGTPTSKSHLPHALSHSHAHISPDIIINFRYSATVRPRSESFSPALTPLLTPHRCCKASAPRCFVWAKGGSMWGSRLHITYKFAHCPWGFVIILSADRFLQATFLQYISYPYSLNHHRCSSQSPHYTNTLD